MSYFEDHCRDTLKKLGDRFERVHRYMDRYLEERGIRHRIKMHHCEGIEIVREKFGEEAAEAARLHILFDCNGYIPKRADYSSGKVDFMGILNTHDSFHKKENTIYPHDTFRV